MTVKNNDCNQESECGRWVQRQAADKISAMNRTAASDHICYTVYLLWVKK